MRNFFFDTRAKMRTKIKERLRKYKYPPEYTQQAVDDVIKQAEYVMNEDNEHSFCYNSSNESNIDNLMTAEKNVKGFR